MNWKYPNTFDFEQFFSFFRFINFRSNLNLYIQIEKIKEIVHFKCVIDSILHWTRIAEHKMALSGMNNKRPQSTKLEDIY